MYRESLRAEPPEFSLISVSKVWRQMALLWAEPSTELPRPGQKGVEAASALFCRAHDFDTVCHAVVWHVKCIMMEGSLAAFASLLRAVRADVQGFSRLFVRHCGCQQCTAVAERNGMVQKITAFGFVW